MAKNRMTFEKHQRDAKKKRKQEEKRALKQKRKDAPEIVLDPNEDSAGECETPDGETPDGETPAVDGPPLT